MKIKSSKMSLAVIATVVLMLSACGKEQVATNDTNNERLPAKNYQWKMVTSWPKNFPGLGMAP